ncbi:MAG: peptidylprolyl isomerase [Burkholderiales bacterium PBB4]|nr:MAG: peptidylprolyl isomerase [Burkholderiales bacterium PBB4]
MHTSHPPTSATLRWRQIAALGLGLAWATQMAQAKAPPPTVRSKPVAEILAASKPQEWRTLDPENTVYLELPTGRVVMELAPDFAPALVQNIKTLVREKYFDGLAMLRAQENYVAQWGDPHDEESSAKSLGTATTKLPPEFTAPITPGMPFTRLPDVDGYAPQVGFSHGFPVGRNLKTGQTWLTHCYAALGVARGNEVTSGTGSSLYVIIGHAPRHLDRNIAVVGRVVQGMDKLSTLPRGTGNLGFYEKPEQRMGIKSMVMAADVPVADRTALEVLRTDSASFAAVANARRNRLDDWNIVPAGHIELCNVPIPVRPIQP